MDEVENEKSKFNEKYVLEISNGELESGVQKNPRGVYLNLKTNETQEMTDYFTIRSLLHCQNRARALNKYIYDTFALIIR